MKTSRWPISKLPIAHLEPFPYHKGELYVELLDRLAKYVTDQLHPNLRETVEHMVEELEHILALQHGKYVEGIQDFQAIHDAFMEDVNSALMALNDNASADLVQDPGSALGATLRELFHPKTRERVHVADYGARGDGVTDNTQAIRDAIAATPPGGTLVFGEGEYHVGDTEFFHGPREMFRITGDITIIGNGAHIIDDSTYADDRVVFSIQGSNVTIDGLNISNIVTGDKGRPVHRGISVGTAASVVSYQHIENITIHNCEFYHSFYPIQVHSNSQYHVRNVRVTGNRVTGMGPGVNCGGIMFQSTDAAPAGNVRDVVVANNHVYDVTTAAAIGLYGVRDATVTGNLCDGSEDIGAGIQTERGAENITITGNTLKNHYNAIWVHDSKNVAVSGNTITHTDNRHDAGRTGVRITVQGIPREQPFVSTGISVTGNTLERCGVHATSFSTVQESDTRIKSLIIANNTIRCENNTGRGILVNRRVEVGVIQGNYIDGSNIADIEIQGHAAYAGKPKMTITGNVLHGDTPLLVLEASYLGRFPFANNLVKNSLPENVYYQSTIGEKQILVMNTANQQAPIGSLGMVRDGKLYKKTGEVNTDWTEI